MQFCILFFFCALENYLYAFTMMFVIVASSTDLFCAVNPRHETVACVEVVRFLDSFAKFVDVPIVSVFPSGSVIFQVTIKFSVAILSITIETL